MAVTSFLLYFFYLGKNLSVYSRIRNIYHIKYSRAVLFYYTSFPLVVFLGSAGVFFSSKYLMLINTLIITTGGYGVIYYQLRFPDFFNALKYEVEKKEYGATCLPEGSIAELKNRLVHIMEQKGLFLDDDVRMRNVADELGISKHQLSRIVNESYGMNFNQLINRYRVHEAMKRLLQQPERSILDIRLRGGILRKILFLPELS